MPPVPVTALSGNRAFTLVEMLVVVAIIGILCVLLLASFQKVLGAADSAKCASNLRTIGQAIGFYVNDTVT